MRLTSIHYNRISSGWISVLTFTKLPSKNLFFGEVSRGHGWKFLLHLLLYILLFSISVTCCLWKLALIEFNIQVKEPWTKLKSERIVTKSATSRDLRRPCSWYRLVSRHIQFWAGAEFTKVSFCGLLICGPNTTDFAVKSYDYSVSLNVSTKHI